MTALTEHTMTLTQSQKHWRAWVKALQTRDASVRAEALDQLSRFLDYWTADLYIPAPIRGVLNGHDTPPPESWDEVFDVDAELLIRSKRHPHVHFGSNESWVGPYGLDERAIESHHVGKLLTMNPWDNADGSKETMENLSRYYCEIQRLIVDCPFADVRRTCRKLLDKAKRRKVEFPSLVNEGPSWVIPISEIIGFKTDHHKEFITIRIPDRYVSDVSDDSDIEFGSRNRNNDSLEGYGYYTSPDATPRPQFSTPAIPINAPPRSRSQTQQRHHLSRNTSQESFAQSYTSSHKSTERKYPHQPHASSEIREFQIGSFVVHGRITNYAKILFFMPKYLLCSSTCHEKLISSARGVSRSNKTYAALLATAEMGCQYFVSYLASKFLEVGGDSVWLKGLEYIPGYIQRIAVFNQKLVQQPWALTEKDVNALTETRDFDGEDEEGWSLNEVAQIATILAMFHCQSAIALGAGVVCEADVFGGTFWRRISIPSDDDTLTTESEDRFTGGKKRPSHTVSGGRQEIIDKLRLRMLTSGHISPDMSFDSVPTLRRGSIRNGKNIDRRVEAIFREVLDIDHTNGVANEDKVVSPTISPSNSSTTPRPKAPQSECDSPMNPVIEDLSRFTLDGIATYTIFPSALPPIQYCWDETKHLLQHLLPDLSSNLDRRFHLSPTPSFLQPHHPYNDDDDDDDPLDITPFKEALHYYSLAIVGIIKDTYNYNLIHEFLGDDLRAFVRRLCLDSKGITKQEWGMMKRLGFLSAEIVEIGVLVSEARFMGVLMYAYKVIGSL